ncbi:PREDICTED: UPF0725 protein EMB2204-like [Camelina sativa]|uniref:UPF0725 protein EMB2204-like n=1 Tax=Camelina sativa TaxID=90675 RepID=A0ABM1QBX2_CAMSA|nr:PREDICTED: UPF0725 protein EMB2204-like [Camelina sativa]
MNGLRQFDCEGNSVPYRALVTLYAKVGLHRYNMWQLTNLQLSGLKKFNMLMGAGASTYCITLDAKEPASSSHQTFQVHVAEECFGTLDLRCYIARPQPTTTTTEVSNEEPLLRWDNDFSLPNWPLSLNAFNDQKRFYLVKKSELRDHDWIRLYLELAVCAENRLLTDEDLSKLKIVGVAIETNQDAENPPLIAKTANVYIRFEDLLGKDSVAILRRIMDETTGYLSLVGDILSQVKAPSSLCLMGEIQNAEQKASSNKRFSRPRRSHGYKRKHGLRSPVRRSPSFY